MVYRAFYVALLFTLINQTIYSQLDDIGIKIDNAPSYVSIDSSGFLIIEGNSPLIDQSIEGGAIEIFGGDIQSVTFTVYHGSEISKIDGNIFIQPNGVNIISTFLAVFENQTLSFSYKVISVGNMDVRSILIFPIETELPGLAKQMEVISSAIPKPNIISREEWGAERF